MAKQTLDLTKRSQSSGTLLLGWLITPHGRYRVGSYQNQQGLVQIIADSHATILSFFHHGQLHTRTRTDHPSDGQISRAARALITQTVLTSCQKSEDVILSSAAAD